MREYPLSPKSFAALPSNDGIPDHQRPAVLHNRYRGYLREIIEDPTNKMTKVDEEARRLLNRLETTRNLGHYWKPRAETRHTYRVTRHVNNYNHSNHYHGGSHHITNNYRHRDSRRAYSSERIRRSPSPSPARPATPLYSPRHDRTNPRATPASAPKSPPRGPRNGCTPMFTPATGGDRSVADGDGGMRRSVPDRWSSINASEPPFAEVQSTRDYGEFRATTPTLPERATPLNVPRRRAVIPHTGELVIPRLTFHRLPVEHRERVLGKCNRAVHTKLEELMEEELGRDPCWAASERRNLVRSIGDYRGDCSLFLALVKKDPNNDSATAYKYFGMHKDAAVAMLQILKDSGADAAHHKLDHRERDDYSYLTSISTSIRFMRSVGVEWEEGKQLFTQTVDILRRYDDSSEGQKRLAKRNFCSMELSTAEDGKTSLRHRLVSRRTAEAARRQINAAAPELIQVLSVDYEATNHRETAKSLYFPDVINLVWSAARDPRALLDDFDTVTPTTDSKKDEEEDASFYAKFDQVSGSEDEEEFHSGDEDEYNEDVKNDEEKKKAEGTQ